MNRSVFAPALTVLVCSALVTSALAQAKPAAPQPSSGRQGGIRHSSQGRGGHPGIAGNIEVRPQDQGSRHDYKLKNMSSAPIAMLKLDEYWYSKGKMVSTDTQRYKQPFQPGEIVEMTTHAPATENPAGWTKNVTFSHANGKVTPKAVKAF